MEEKYISGFDELFEDGMICGDTTYTTPMSLEDMDAIMAGVIAATATEHRQ